MINLSDNRCVLSLKDNNYILDKIDDFVIGRFAKNVDELEEIKGVYEDGNVSYPVTLSSFGFINYKERLIHLSDEKGYFTFRFHFKGWEKLDGFINDDNFPQAKNKKEGIKIVYIDETNQIEIEQYFFLYKQDNTIVSWLNFKNIGEKVIHLNRTMSMMITLGKGDFDITTFTGKWAQERHITRNKIHHGVFKNSSTCGISSSYNNPAIMINDKDNYYLMNLIYSGNHMSLIEEDYNDSYQMMIGMNDFMQNIILKNNESFKTPEAILTFGRNEDEIRINSHNFITNNILSYKKEFPIIFNAWEAAYFNLNKDNFKKMADHASRLGAEIFVIDDGWFASRFDETTSLGDWYLNKNKFDSFKEIKDYLSSKNLKFGLWIEPEMVSKKSELFKNHPEFVMKYPNQETILMRHQMILDLANEECVNYLISTISNLFDEAKPDYVKWDFNRLFSDCYSNSTFGGRYFYDYYVGLYRFMNTLKNKYPNIIFEGCASGGARFDLGILSYFDVIWTSDGTDAKERALIQDGTSLVYPVSCMSNHVSISPNHQTGKRSSIEDRINVALFGEYGFELDLTKISKNHFNLLKKSIVFYKKYRPLILTGDNYSYRVDDNKLISLGSVSKNKMEAIYLVVSLNKEYKMIKFKGLLPDKIYHISLRKQDNVDLETFPDLSGEYLMEKGITLSSLFLEKDKEENEINIASRIIYLNVVK